MCVCRYLDCELSPREVSLFWNCEEWEAAIVGIQSIISADWYFSRVEANQGGEGDLGGSGNKSPRT